LTEVNCNCHNHCSLQDGGSFGDIVYHLLPYQGFNLFKEIYLILTTLELCHILPTKSGHLNCYAALPVEPH